jgi:hypothetical protein
MEHRPLRKVEQVDSACSQILAHLSRRYGIAITGHLVEQLLVDEMYLTQVRGGGIPSYP